MGDTDSGFSMIESLLTLVVLSVGLLGLGQLQVRLWFGSGELHTTEAAALLGDNLLEILPVDWLSDQNKQAASRAFEPSIHAATRHSRLPAPDDALTATRVDLHWASPAGERSLSMQKTSRSGLQPEDTRWLLPPE
jgi:prepilin-type N-terminal cleavage/methylation domain-containing protein